MRVPRRELAQILSQLLEKLPASKLTTEAASYLLSENRTGELDSLARDLINYRAERGIVEVTVVSARALTPGATREVKQQVKRLYPKVSRIIINHRLDENQIGGLRLELPGRQLDLSVRGKLNQLQQLTAGS